MFDLLVDQHIMFFAVFWRKLQIVFFSYVIIVNQMIQVNNLDSRNQSCIQNSVSDKFKRAGHTRTLIAASMNFNDNSKFQKKREANG